MKRIIVSIGAVALGTVALHAQHAPGLSKMEASKPWSVSASLRGFYDDNYTTSPNATARNSFGAEFAPGFALNLPLEQTLINASYLYSAKYYNDRDAHQVDQSHQFSGKIDHAFSERYKLLVSDQFVLAQEPEILNQVGLVTIPLRTQGNNIRNSGLIDFSAQLTELLTFQLSYANNYYDFEQTSSDIRSDPTLAPGNPLGLGSLSARLDRIEHQPEATLRWKAFPKTDLLGSYSFTQVSFTSDDPLAVGIAPSIRNSRTHTFKVGADHNFNATLNGSIRLGAQYTEYYNQNETSVSPYADVSMSYSYAPGSFLQGGIRHSKSATDVASVSASGVTTDTESTSVYLSLTHRLTAKTTANVLGQYQNSAFNDGLADGQADNYYILSANLAYRINVHWTAEGGWNFDRLDSDNGAGLGSRSYTRNRVYLGLRATY